MTRKKAGTPADPARLRAQDSAAELRRRQGRPPARRRGLPEILASLQDRIAGLYETARHARGT